VQLTQGHAGWDLNPPPDHGTDPEQPNLELQNLRSWRRTRRLGFGWSALWQMKVSRSLVSSGRKPCTADPLPECPTKPHALQDGPELVVRGWTTAVAQATTSNPDRSSCTIPAAALERGLLDHP
jgi:hypothetical protein